MRQIILEMKMHNNSVAPLFLMEGTWRDISTMNRNNFMLTNSFQIRDEKEIMKSFAIFLEVEGENK